MLGGTLPVQPRELRISCPTCGKEVVRSPRRATPFFPFCSERCKLVDLGNWFDGEHRIEGPSAEGPAAGRDGDEGG